MSSQQTWPFWWCRRSHPGVCVTHRQHQCDDGHTISSGTWAGGAGSAGWVNAVVIAVLITTELSVKSIKGNNYLQWSYTVFQVWTKTKTLSSLSERFFIFIFIFWSHKGNFWNGFEEADEPQVPPQDVCAPPMHNATMLAAQPPVFWSQGCARNKVFAHL